MTERQKVAELMLSSLSYLEIGEKLGLKHSNVNYHAQNVLIDSDCETRNEYIADSLSDKRITPDTIRPLTNTEDEILTLLINGYAQHEIAVQCDLGMNETRNATYRVVRATGSRSVLHLLCSAYGLESKKVYTRKQNTWCDIANKYVGV
jgi:DNA-binding CsgD family transcriptional regulator